MNYDGPRQKKDGTWGYTSRNDRDEYPHGIGYCAPFREFKPETIAMLYGDDEDGRARYEAYIAPYRAAAAAGKYHDGGHATAEEACECYKQFLLDFDLRFFTGPDKPTTLHICEGSPCGEMTAGGAEIAGRIRRWNLCAKHRTREAVAILLRVGQSMHS